MEVSPSTGHSRSGAEEPNAIVQLEEGARTIPNGRATQVELYEGLKARSVNCWPSVEFDLLSVNSLFKRMMPAGFYYKTFMWPQSLWMKYEVVIRKASGLGVSPDLPDPDRYEKTYAHCDLLVVGAGPSGLTAALAAGRSGARVIIADEQAMLGGRLLSSREWIDGLPAVEWVDKAVAELQQMETVQLLPRSTVFGYHDYNYLTINQRLSDHLPQSLRPASREKLWRVRAKRVLLATGALERPLVFSNNDRPGVMLASALSTYVNQYAVTPGNQAVIFTNNDSAYQTALDLANAGVEVVAVVDCRENPQGSLPEQVRESGIEIIVGSVVTDVAGGRRVKGVDVMTLDNHHHNEALNGTVRKLQCDLLAISGGWSPVIHLSSQSGAKAEWSEESAAFLPGTPVEEEVSIGSANGTWDLASCLEQATKAGIDAALESGFSSAGNIIAPRAEKQVEEPIMPLWRVPSRYPAGRGGKQFVDFQNDTGAADIMLAAREGYHSIEHVKRYTALGFGTDQGKVSNINGMAILASASAERSAIPAPPHSGPTIPR